MTPDPNANVSRRLDPDHPRLAVLVHGLWMTGYEMGLVRQYLRRAGYRTYRFCYPSVSKPLDWNVNRLYDFVRQLPPGEVNFVGHSLGGVMIQQLLNRHPKACTGRVVAMGSPFNGSWTARRFSRWPLAGVTIGRSITEVMEPHEARLDADVDFGVIAGDLSFGVARFIGGFPGPNDGTVGVEETRLKDATDHVVQHINHFGMLSAKGSLRQMVHFLEHGRFAPAREIAKRRWQAPESAAAA
ncbi:MAG: alpha/beta fold hydrolase [Verrucomicrobiota bacterium]